MSLSIDDVKRVAHLARIDITDAEADDVRAKLDGLFRMIEQMRAVDTSGIVPMSHAQDVALTLREDRVTDQDHHEQYQSGAPAVEGSLYLVPKVIE